MARVPVAPSAVPVASDPAGRRLPEPEMRERPRAAASHHPGKDKRPAQQPAQGLPEDVPPAMHGRVVLVVEADRLQPMNGRSTTRR